MTVDSDDSEESRQPKKFIDGRSGVRVSRALQNCGSAVFAMGLWWCSVGR